MNSNKLKVLLVQYQLLRGMDSFTVMPSLSFASLTANLDKSLCDVKIFEFYTKALFKLDDDENILVANSKKQNELKDILSEYKPDIVGLTCKSFEYNNTREVAKIIKSYNKEIITVLGGYHATIAYEEILQSDDPPVIDYLIRGEGEKSFDEFVKAVYYNNTLSKVPGLSYRNNREIVNNPVTELLNLDTVRKPDRSARLNRKFDYYGYHADVVETSRGCVFDCSFCSIRAMYGKSFRTFSIERVIEDIKDAAAHGAELIFFADDNITIDGKRLERLCDAIVEAGLNNITYLVQASIKGLAGKENLIDKMAACGMKWVFIGIESSEEDDLKFVQKSNQFKVNEVADVIQSLKKRKLFVQGGIILGMPDESEQTIKNKVEYLRTIDLDFSSFSILTPFPGTQVREELTAKNLITNYNDFSKYNLWHVNIRTEHLTSDELFEIVRKYEKEFNFRITTLIRFLIVFPRCIKYIFSLKVLQKVFFTR